MFERFTSRPTRTIKVICCYSGSEQDKDLLENLMKHLSSLKQEGVITTWDECEISAGEEWHSKVDDHLDTATLILLLISADFIDSDHWYYQKLERALERYENAEGYVIPVLLRPGDWKERWFGDMPVLPRNGVAVTSWIDIDEAFQDVAKGIRECVQEIWRRSVDAESANKEELELVVEPQKESASAIEIEKQNTQTKSASRPTRTIEVFCSYSRPKQDENLSEYEQDKNLSGYKKDEELLDNLVRHLSSLKREGVITTWDRREITAGEEWQQKIDDHLDTATLILLLISADFIDSDDCYYQELERALERYENAEGYVMPVLLRPVDWKERRFGDMPVLPRNGIAVTSWTNIDEAFQDVAKGIREFVVQQIWRRDERGVNEAYNQLKKALAAKEWRKADEATKAIVFKISGQEETGILTAEDIKKFPFQDIYAIDQLWLKHSNGRFGLSAQKRILQQKNYEDFIKDVGWRVDDSWLEYENLNLTIDAPEGYFPYCGVHFWKAVPLPPPESPPIPYYRLDKNFYLKYPPYTTPPYNPYYQQQRERQLKELRQQLKLDPQSRLDQLREQLNSDQPFNSYPLYQPTISNRPGGGAGGGLIALGLLARAALPWVAGAAAVGGLAWVGWKMYKNYRDEKEKQQKENEIKEKINALLSRLD